MNEATAHPIDLLVLDDHDIVRQGVMLLVQQEAWIARCRGAASIDEALLLMAQAPADAAIVDLSLKQESGLDAIARLLSGWPRLPIVVLSMYADPIHRQRALQRGAMGLVAKDDASEELIVALKKAVAGERFLSSSVRLRQIGELAGPGHEVLLSFNDALAQLTNRERQVLTLIGQGRSATEVAAELGRSVKTVETHRNNLREKLGLKSNRQLLQFSARWVQFDRAQ